MPTGTDITRILALAAAFSAVSTLFPSALFAQAKSGLSAIDNPGGGKIVFGPIDGQTTEAGAMGYILRAIHSQMGDRPQVGKLFQARGTQSVATFFRVNRRTQGTGQRTGLIIVTKVSTGRVEAGVISDESDHFRSSFNPMLKTLLSSWHPFDGAETLNSGEVDAGGPVAPLQKFVSQDRTVSLDLPAGWKVNPASTGGGSIVAQGPYGEGANFGYTILVADLNNPNARRTYQTVANGGLRGTAYAKQIYYPLGGDMVKAFVDIVTLFRQKNNLPPRPFQIRSSESVQSPPGQRCVHVTGVANPQDAQNAYEDNTVFCVTAPSPAAGVFLAVLNSTTVPLALAPKERATLRAVMASFWVDTAAVQRMANAYAAPAIEAIHAVGRAAAAQARAAHELNEIHNSSVYQRWDSMDRRSKEFSNYLLGYSVVQDNYEKTHGTFWNADADALVKADPQRFEYVNAPNFWKGVDY